MNVNVSDEDLKAAGLVQEDEEYPFACDLCERRFKNKGGLGAHKAFSHEGRTPGGAVGARKVAASRERKAPGKVASSGADAGVQKIVNKTVENL